MHLVRIFRQRFDGSDQIHCTGGPGGWLESPLNVPEVFPVQLLRLLSELCLGSGKERPKGGGCPCEVLDEVLQIKQTMSLVLVKNDNGGRLSQWAALHPRQELELHPFLRKSLGREDDRAISVLLLHSLYVELPSEVHLPAMSSFRARCIFQQTNQTPRLVQRPMMEKW